MEGLQLRMRSPFYWMISNNGKSGVITTSKFGASSFRRDGLALYALRGSEVLICGADFYQPPLNAGIMLWASLPLIYY